MRQIIITRTTRVQRKPSVIHAAVTLEQSKRKARGPNMALHNFFFKLCAFCALSLILFLILNYAA